MIKNINTLHLGRLPFYNRENPGRKLVTWEWSHSKPPGRDGNKSWRCALPSTTAEILQMQPISSYLWPGKSQNMAQYKWKRSHPPLTEPACHWGQGSSISISAMPSRWIASQSPAEGNQKMAQSEWTAHWEFWCEGMALNAHCGLQSYRMPSRSDEQIRSVVLFLPRLPVKYAQLSIFCSFLNCMDAKLIRGSDSKRGFWRNLIIPQFIWLLCFVLCIFILQ